MRREQRAGDRYLGGRAARYAGCARRSSGSRSSPSNVSSEVTARNRSKVTPVSGNCTPAAWGPPDDGQRDREHPVEDERRDHEGADRRRILVALLGEDEAAEPKRGG